MDKILQEAAKGLRKVSTPAEQILWGYLRTKKLDGFKVVRFLNEEVEQDIDGVLNRIREELKGSTPVAPPRKWTKD